MGSARFRPTRRQALGRGLYLGALTSLGVLPATLLSTVIDRWWQARVIVPWWLWPLLVVGPVLLGVVCAVSLGRHLGTDVEPGGIRTVSAFGGGWQPWSRVVDLRAERRGRRTVVSVYLESGGHVRLRAPYDGELFAADPRFDLKVYELSHVWRSHRFGGIAG